MSGTLTVPASHTGGTVLMRLIGVSSNSSPGLACGNYNYGEAEDYQINITPLCHAMLSAQAGNWTAPATWSCNRVPVAGETATVSHAVNVPTATPPNPTGTLRQIRLTSGGKLVYDSAGTLKIN
jgi:hypothetical protein